MSYKLCDDRPSLYPAPYKSILHIQVYAQNDETDAGLKATAQTNYVKS